jgi:hypothetical protein
LTEEILLNQREKIVDVWYLGTNQNGINFELLTMNPYINQRRYPTCIYNVKEYFTRGHELTIHERLFVEQLN